MFTLLFRFSSRCTYSAAILEVPQHESVLSKIEIRLIKKMI